MIVGSRNGGGTLGFGDFWETDFGSFHLVNICARCVFTQIVIESDRKGCLFQFCCQFFHSVDMGTNVTTGGRLE